MERRAPSKPRLLYDGDCRFCAYWVRYWQRLTGSKVEYRPYQEVLSEYPGLTAQECRRAVQLIEPNGYYSAGADASFRILAYGRYGIYAAILRRSRLVTRIAEWGYTFVSRRRDYAGSAARMFWGSERYPAQYDKASSIFVRAIALVYFAAFVSLALQITALIGSGGILPVERYFNAITLTVPSGAWWRYPSLFWVANGDPILVAGCLTGAAAALVVAAGFLQIPLLIACYLLYLSLFTAGQVFMGYQWDLLLLEAGFLAVFLPLRTAIVPWLFRLLLFRFMILSGCVKLLSGDPSWAALSALDFHYETQPLPTPLAWYAHQLPALFDRLCITATFVIELAFPFLIFTARRPRMLAAVGFVLLEIGILLTGNYNFFNILTIALCLFLIDDQQFRRSQDSTVRRSHRSAIPIRMLVTATAFVIVLHNIYFLARPFVRSDMPKLMTQILSPFIPFRIVNGYGLFAVMTTTRPEIIVQGSNNGRDWAVYEFRYKPGDPSYALRWNIPHQPRLDWQMWFAALSTVDRAPWFGNFLLRLLQNSSDVTALLRHNPFAEKPPRYVRALLYDYRYSTVEERKRTGEIWQRRALGMYYPAVNLP